MASKYISSKYISIERGHMSERDGSNIARDLERTFWCAGSIQNNLKRLDCFKCRLFCDNSSKCCETFLANISQYY